MFAKFVCNGYVVLERNVDYIPDNEDRIKVLDDFYVVNDRVFFFTKRENNDGVMIYLTKISE